MYNKDNKNRGFAIALEEADCGFIKTAEASGNMAKKMRQMALRYGIPVKIDKKFSRSFILG